MPANSIPDVVAPPPRHPRFPLIDGLRAIAVLSIVVVHAVPAQEIGTDAIARLVAHLTIGVTIFFVISGFLLFRPFIAYRGGGGPPPAVAQYAKRRFLRIYPAYWLALTALAILPGLNGLFSGDWWAHYMLVQTVPAHSACEGISYCGLPQTWSLVVEVTFYASLPLYVIGVERLTRDWRPERWMIAQFTLLAALSGASALLHFVILDAPLRSWPGGTVVGFVFWFALGMALAIVSVVLEKRRTQPWPVRAIASNPILPWTAALIGYLLISALLPATGPLTRSDQLLSHAALGTIAALIFVPAVFGDRAGGAPRAFLALPLVSWLGLISYGVFLWHRPITLELGVQGAELPSLVVLAVTLAITVPIAAASYYFVERPLLRLKHRRLRDWRQVVRVGSGAASPVRPDR